MIKLVIIAVAVFQLSSSCDVDCNAPNWDCFQQDQIISCLTDPKIYDKNTRPSGENNYTLSLDVDMTINELQASQSVFTAYMTVKYIYKDEKLAYANKTKKSSILGDDNVPNLIWLPNVQLKDDNATTVLSIKQSDIIITISNTGIVAYSYKMIAQFYCYLNLKKFPFDDQECTIKFSDWEYNVKDLVLNLKRLKAADNLQFTEYILDEYSVHSELNNGPYESDAILDDQFSELKLNIKFHRDVGYYLMDFFIPSYLLVFTAWVTFWLQADAGPPRATLGASTVIAFITLHLGVAKDIPKVSYVKASDVWFMGISFFIFSSLAEFAFVNVVWRRKKTIELKKDKDKYILKSAVRPSAARKELRKFETQQSVWSLRSTGSFNSGSTQVEGSYLNMDNGDVKSNHSAITIPDTPTVQQTWKTMTPQEVAIWIDRKARIIFPIIFLLFNIFYWTFVYVL